ncbi:hypothetical protein HYE68_005202 [Fusarium pseudograminearum]|nr:hypothetical protein HYE68_005202 [Fusarium pseudograminearum]
MSWTNRHNLEKQWAKVRVHQGHGDQTQFVQRQMMVAETSRNADVNNNEQHEPPAALRVIIIGTLRNLSVSYAMSQQDVKPMNVKTIVQHIGSEQDHAVLVQEWHGYVAIMIDAVPNPQRKTMEGYSVVAGGSHPLQNDFNAPSYWQFNRDDIERPNPQ